LVLTFDFAFAISNASTHTNYLIKLLKNEFYPTHNYTGQTGSLNSPGLLSCI